MLRALSLVAAVGGLAVAAPVPKAPPPPAPKTSANLTLGTGTLNGQLIQITYPAPPVLLANPGANAAVNRPATRTMSVQLAAVKVTTADGTELTGDDLKKKLAEMPAVARSTVALDPEWRKLFADDMLFIEPSGKPAAPGAVLPGGGAVIRPGVIRPALPVVPPVEKLPVKEEKKEEKK